MSVGFRKSLLGFNCEDVMSYIEKSHQAFSKKEKDFNAKIEELDGVIKNVTNELENLKNAKAEVEAELKINKKGCRCQVCETVNDTDDSYCSKCGNKLN